MGYNIAERTNSLLLEPEVSFILRNPEIPKADLPSGKNDSEREENYHAQAAVTYKTKGLGILFYLNESKMQIGY